MLKLINNDIFLLSLTLVGILIPVILVSINFYMLKTDIVKYDYKKSRIELDLVRENYEEKIMKLNEELAKGTGKWESLNHLIINNNLNNEFKNTVKIPDYFVKMGISKEIKVQENFIFILMPFLKSKENLYKKIKETLKKIKFDSYRSDEHYMEKNIYNEIISNIATAKIIIADIDGRNPNVFYELGIAHSLDKPTILISKNKDKVPFDLLHKNIIFYDTLIDLENKLKEVIPQLLLKNNN